MSSIISTGQIIFRDSGAIINRKIVKSFVGIIGVPDYYSTRKITHAKTWLKEYLK